MIKHYDLLVVSFGGGQDSTTILYQYFDNPGFRAMYPCDRFAVVMSSTGADEEHPETYEHINYISALCEENNTDFFFLTPELGFHSDAWTGLRDFYRRTNTVGSKAFPKTCTDNLKIQPIYRWLEWYIGNIYKLPWGKGKKAIQTFGRLYSPIGMMIGIASDEADRRIGDQSGEPLWMQKYIDKVFPLVDLGWDRGRCQIEMINSGRPAPPPSNCMICPFMSEIELVWLFTFHPERYYEWVEIEANKIRAWEGRTKNNLGVWGKKLLPQVLSEAIQKYGHMTRDELQEYKFSHGHCVQSKY